MNKKKAKDLSLPTWSIDRCENVLQIKALETSTTKWMRVRTYLRSSSFFIGWRSTMHSIGGSSENRPSTGPTGRIIDIFCSTRIDARIQRSPCRRRRRGFDWFADLNRCLSACRCRCVCVEGEGEDCENRCSVGDHAEEKRGGREINLYHRKFSTR